MNRWQLSLHEAGHAVVAHTLGVEVYSVAVSDDSGGACALQQCSTTTAAMIAAAGPIAGDLSKHLTGPQNRVVDCVCDIPEDTPGAAIMKAATGGSHDYAAMPSDEQILARWAIEGVEDQPERWADRLSWLKAVVSREVKHNQLLIFELAEQVFHAGAVSHPFKETTR